MTSDATEEARLPSRASSRRLRLHATLLAITLSAVLAGCAVIATHDTFWAVRRVDAGDETYIEARSHIASHGMAPVLRMRSVPVAERKASAARLELRRATASKQVWDAHGPAASREIGRALNWLQGSRALSGMPAELTLIAVDPGSAVDITERELVSDFLTLTIYVPVDAGSSPRLSSTLRSGLATVFHELIHVRSRSRIETRKRADEEYLATMFESCYLIDSIQTGDRLHLKRSRQHSIDYVLASSLKGADEAIAALQGIAGGDIVDAASHESVGRLRAFCQRFTATEWQHPIKP